jgi:hypothetical protein
MMAGSNFPFPDPFHILAEWFSDLAPDSCWGQVKPATLGGKLSADGNEAVLQLSQIQQKVTNNCHPDGNTDNLAVSVMNPPVQTAESLTKFYFMLQVPPWGSE